jgi:manganese/zinc/iron transport system permease protein
VICILSVGLRGKLACERKRFGSVVADSAIRILTRNCFLAMAMLLSLASPVGLSAAEPRVSGNRSLTDRSTEWPTWQQWRRVLLLQDYNTRVVVFGVAVLGAGAGLIGGFTLLRKRALMGDALSHASLPGIALAFVTASMLGGEAKSLPYLLAGATLSGLVGIAAILWIRNQTRLKEDAALGIVLSVFFGAGVAIMGVIQQMEAGHAAGLEGFIYGKTASMRGADAKLIVVASLIAIGVCLVLYKEFKLLCFDEAFAGSRGFRVVLLDVVLMSTVVLITIVGLQAVGLILMIALMVIPAAAARFWTDEMWRMMVYSMLLGMVGCVVGATISAVFPKLPSGAMIVLVCSLFFFLSMLFGRSRGVLVRYFRRRRLNRRVTRQHLLRAMYESIEPQQTSKAFDPQASASLTELLPMRSWSRRRLLKAINLAEGAELVTLRGQQAHLTRAGYLEAARLTRQHRMWEMYLIAYAEIAPSMVDRDADAIEHVLEPQIIDQLEELLEEEKSIAHVPKSPHQLGALQ